MTAFDPTDEQIDAMGLFVSGVNLAIEAGAGTGKTTTLQLLARSTPRAGSYMAFNRSIVNEAKRKMPMNVQSSTAHSLAMRQFGHQYSHRLDGERAPSWRLARLLDIGPVIVQYGTGRKVLQPGFLASLVMRGIRQFCASGDLVPSGHHIPFVPGIDPPGGDGKRATRNNEHLRAHLADPLAAAWRDLCDPAGRLPFEHDHYLKMWSLNDPVVPGEFLLFDEAQDATPVMLSVAEQQVARGMQVVFVGDSQQQIYGWRGAVNALQHVPADCTTYLTQSWRFGQPIADLANLVLAELDAGLRIVGNPHMGSLVTTGMGAANAVLTRGNSASLEYLLRYQRDGKRPHLIGGGEELLRFAKGVHDLQERGTSSHPDLACFGSWGEVKEYVADDPQGDDLALMVHLIDEYGLAIVIDSLDGMIAEDVADVVISTAHKAKGREWNSVRIAADFPDPAVRGAGAEEEWRLLYVAITRAREVLDIGAVEAIRLLIAEQHTPRLVPRAALPAAP